MFYYTTMANWLDLSSTSNMLKAAYVKGFVDISGGDFIARTGNLYIQGTSSLVGAVTICGELRAVYPAGSIPSNAIVGGAGISASTDVALTQRLQVSGDVSLNSKLYVAGAAVFAGIPTAPTATAGTNTTQIATTAFVKSAVDGLVASAPAALDTLNELAAALGNDAAFSTTVTNSLASKAPLANPALTGVPTAPTATAGTNTTQLATTAFVTSAVSLKPSFSQVDVSLALKPSFAQVDASLNLKPSFTQVDASLNLKSNLTYVDASLNLKSNLTYVDASLNLKSNLTYVDASLNLKSAVTYVDASLNLKPSFTQADASLNLKANLVSPTFTGPFVVESGDVSMNNNLNLGGNLVVNGNLTVFRQENASIINTTVSNYEIVITKDISLNGNLIIANNASLNNNLSVANDVSLNNKLYVANDVLLNSKLAVSNDASFNMRVDICGNLYAQYPEASIPVSAVNSLSSVFSQIDASLNLKSDITYVDASLNLKSDITYVDASLNLKSNITYVDASLNLKASTSNVDASLNLKSDITYVDASLNLKASTSNVDASLNLKSDITYVDASFNLKASTSNVDASLNLKSDITYVDASLNLKSDITYVDASLNLKADLASPTLTGIPSAPTAAASTNTTQIATTEFVKTAVANLVASAPATLDTLNELALALGSDASFSTTVSTAIGLKAPINNPTFTGTVSGITKAMVGLGNADDTTDANKPISTAMQNALDLKANISAVDASLNLKAGLASPTFTGTPNAPTAAYDNSSNQLATTGFVQGRISSIINSAPAALDTLNELAAALGNDANYAATITTALSLKAPLANPTFTGTVGGITKSMVGLGYADDTSDANKPVSNATQTALDLKASISNVDASLNLKANIASPTFTGTVSGITKSMVGLGDADNTSDANKPVSNATQTALNLKANISAVDISFSTYKTTVDASFGLKADAFNAPLTGVPTAPTAGAGANSTQLANTQFVTGAISTYKGTVDNSFSSVDTIKANKASPTFTGIVTADKVTFGDASFNGRVDISGVLSVTQTVNSVVTNTNINNYNVSVTNDLSLNGKLLVSGDVSFNSKLFVSNTITISGDIIPQTANQYNLGSADKPFKSLFVSNNTINLIGTDSTTGNTTTTGISVDNGKMKITNPSGPEQQVVVTLNDKTGFGMDSSFANATIDVSGTAIISGDVSLNRKLYVGGDVSMNGRVDICGNLYAQYPINSIPTSAIIDGVTLSYVNTSLALKAPINNPTFTGTVGGITKSMVGLANADNTTDLGKPISTATQSALDLKANISVVDTSLNLKANLANPTFTGTVGGITKSMVGLGSVDNTSDASKPISTATQTALDLKAALASPTFTGTPNAPTAVYDNSSNQIATTGFVQGRISSIINSAPAALDTLNELAAALGNDANYAATITSALSLKAPLANPTFTGTVGGITKSMVGLANADNTSDLGKPISTATQSALDLKASISVVDTSLNLKANLANPTFTGTVGGITKSMVGLGSVDNTSDTSKPISTATQNALDLKASIGNVDASLNLKASITYVDASLNLKPSFSQVDASLNLKPSFSQVDASLNLKPSFSQVDASLNLKSNITYVDASLNLKANLANPTFTGTVGGITQSMVGLGVRYIERTCCRSRK